MTPLQNWQAQIDQVQIVSFDVFDTLLLRQHYRPVDIFAELPLHRAPLPPRLQRILAEKLARWHHRNQQDVSLDQIYAWLPGNGQQEIDTELRSVYSNPDVAPLLAYAQAKGKQIIAVSDMYLPRQAVVSLLQAAGLKHISHIFVSADVGTSKASGELYDHVCKTLAVSPDQILHIGDNIWSDHHQARKKGLAALYLPTRRERFEACNPLHPALFERLRQSKHSIHSLLLGLNRDRFLDQHPQQDYWYVLGYSTLGPIVNAFVEWIHERVQNLGLRRVFFLARDGALPQQVFSLRYPQREAIYTHASRRLFLLPALVDCCDQTLIDGLCGGLPGTSAEEYWLRLGIESIEITALLRQHFQPGEKITSLTDHLRLRAFFQEALPLLRPHAEKERATLLAYGQQIGLFDGDGLLVDLGWRASSQRYLEMACPQLKGSHGAYFGLETNAYNNGNMAAFFFQHGLPRQHRHLAMHCVELIELMFSAPETSIRCLAQTGTREFQAQRETSSPEETQRAAIVATLHKAALDFTRDLLRLEGRGHDVHLDAKDAYQFLEPVMLRPSASDISHIGQVHHALGLGGSRYETLLPMELPATPVALLRQLVATDRRRLYWPRGVTRGIAFRHGPLAGLGARCAIAAYLLLVQSRNLVYRCLGR